MSNTRPVVDAPDDDLPPLWERRTSLLGGKVAGTLTLVVTLPLWFEALRMGVVSLLGHGGRFLWGLLEPLGPLPGLESWSLVIAGLLGIAFVVFFSLLVWLRGFQVRIDLNSEGLVQVYDGKFNSKVVHPYDRILECNLEPDLSGMALVIKRTRYCPVRGQVIRRLVLVVLPFGTPAEHLLDRIRARIAGAGG